MKTLALFILCFSSIYAVSGQKHLANALQLSYSDQVYLDGRGISQDEAFSPSRIKAKNTQGYYIGLGYERTTKFGFSMYAALQFGRRTYNISIERDLSNFDPEAARNLTVCCSQRILILQ